VSRRLLSLYAGLTLFGAGVALMVRADLGLDPWDVLHQGLARRLGVSLGRSASDRSCSCSSRSAAPAESDSPRQQCADASSRS